MDSGIKLEGMEELINTLNSMGEKSEIAVKNALLNTGDMYKADLVPKIPRSLMPRKPNEGANSWRSEEHAADHIKRSKVLGEDGSYYVLIGISRADSSKWFYLKFIEYGTSKMPARAPFATTIAEGKGKYNDNIISVLKEELGL